MEYSSNMSTEKDSPSSENDKNALNFDRYPAGRLSPSSWDDSNEEFSDEDSCKTVEIPEDDRRQSLARVRRRAKGITSPCFDADNSIDKNLPYEFVGCSAKPIAHKVIIPNLSPVHHSWCDWDSEEIIFGIENYLNDKRLLLIRSKIADNQTNVNECVSVLNRKGTDQTKMFSSVHFRCNLDGKSQEIVEVGKSKSDTGLRSNKTPRSAIPSWSQTDVIDRASDGIPKSSNDDTQEKSETNNTADQKPVFMKYSSEEKFRGLPNENDCDESNSWQRIRSAVKMKNTEYDMTLEESEYVSNSLKYVFDEKINHMAKFGQDGFEIKEKGQFGVDVSADEGDRNCEKANESKTPDLPEKTVKETVNFGMENLFHVEEQDEISIPRSGRESFLARGSSSGWSAFTSRHSSRRARGTHTMSLSSYLKETDNFMYFNEEWERNRLQDGYTERDMSVKEDTSRKRYGSNSSSNTVQMNERANVNKNDEDGNSTDGRQYSSASFRSKILLDLNLSDNEEKCSAIERMVFGDSPHENSFRKMRSSGSVVWSSPKDITTSVENNMAITGKLENGTVEESYNGKTHIHLYDSHQFGIGDSKWNADKSFGRINFPQDRGDITCERPEREAGWYKLITSLEGTQSNEKPKQTVFWVELGKNNEFQYSTDTTTFQTNQKWTADVSKPTIKHLPTRKTRPRRSKAKKRKRDSFLTKVAHSELPSQNQWENKFFDRRGNWLVGTTTRCEDALTRNKRWLGALVITRKRSGRTDSYQCKEHSSATHNDSKFSDCFCNLFKQIVNIFTVSRKSRK